MQNKIDTVYLPGETNNLHPITEYSASLLETKKGNVWNAFEVPISGQALKRDYKNTRIISYNIKLFPIL